MVALTISLIILFVASWYAAYFIGRYVEMQHWFAHMPHVWMTGEEKCRHCGKTMQECGIEVIHPLPPAPEKP